MARATFKYLLKSIYTLDIGCKLNIHKTLKKCPGHVPHVICTFSLRPESKGRYSRVVSPYVRSTVQYLVFMHNLASQNFSLF